MPIENIFSTLEERLNSCSFIKIIHFFVNEFYLISNYTTDLHDRVAITAVNENFLPYLNIPLVDILKSFFIKKNKINITKTFEIIFSCDFDILNIWDTLGIKGSIKRFAKNLIALRFKTIYLELLSFFLANYFLKFNYLLHDESFYFINNKINDTIKIKNIAFFLIEKDNEIFDVKNNFSTKSFKSFINKIDNTVEFAIHPNYNTHKNGIPSLKKQLYKFYDIFNQFPKSSRFHYLKAQFPDDLLLLEELRISIDYTYSFPDSTVFRGSRSCPVKLWSFSKNKPIQVISNPLALMDGTLSNYLHVNFEEAWSICKTRIDLSLLYGETINLLWHNRNLNNNNYVNNYHQKLYKQIKQYIQQNIQNPIAI